MCWHIIRWNPKCFAWNNLSDDINLLKSGNNLIKPWECRGRNCIKRGNGFFMVRQGEEPRGIMGSGFIYNCAGKDYLGGMFIELSFKTLILPEEDKMLTRDYLRYMFPYVYWDTPKTGTVVDDDVAEILCNELICKMKRPALRRELALNFAF